MQSMAEQEKLQELPEQPSVPAGQAEPTGECKLRLVNRDQLTMAQVDVEHIARRAAPNVSNDLETNLSVQKLPRVESVCSLT
jgi:hypothetical protein